MDHGAVDDYSKHSRAKPQGRTNLLALLRGTSFLLFVRDVAARNDVQDIADGGFKCVTPKRPRAGAFEGPPER